MTWKAWLEGHAFDLETLAELFAEGDPLVAKDPQDEYYLESPGLQGTNGQPGSAAADALMKRVNGVARALRQDFRPVHLKGRFTGPDGSVSVLLTTATLEARTRLTATATVLRDGVPVPTPPPKGPRYAKLAEQDPDVADVLRILGQPEPLDWYDIYKTWEIVKQAVGGPREATARGWITQADINRLKASANHPGISGDQARHARMQGTPRPGETMTTSQADSLIRELVSKWIESRPSY